MQAFCPLLGMHVSLSRVEEVLRKRNNVGDRVYMYLPLGVQLMICTINSTGTGMHVSIVWHRVDDR